MSQVIYTCPKCGHDCREYMIATFPAIPVAECTNPDCDWKWEGEREAVIRKPFPDSRYPNPVQSPDYAHEKPENSITITANSEDLALADMAIAVTPDTHVVTAQQYDVSSSITIPV